MTQDTDRTRPLVVQIAAAFEALRNCERAGNDEWMDIWADRLDSLCRDHLPSGSGFDNGTELERDTSRPDRLVFLAGFHHMNDSGFYDGWTHHRVVVSPAFVSGFDIRVTGRDRRGIKDYIAETFSQALDSPVAMPE